MQLDPLLHDLLCYRGFPVNGPRAVLLRHTLEAFSRIPYENITKIIRSKESLGAKHKETPAEVIRGYIKDGTGGTCFPLTYTLVYLLKSLGYEAHPILADRRYGSDTHCAVLAKIDSNDWHLIDPGYLIHTPCKVPSSGALRYELPFTGIELLAEEGSNKVALSTTTVTSSGELSLRYRLTYKTTPVDTSELFVAWDRSFEWEMMSYPIISSAIGDAQIYLQKNSLLIRSRTGSTRATLSQDKLIEEIATRLSISQEIVRRAVESL